MPEATSRNRAPDHAASSSAGVRRFPCARCGARLEYVPGSAALRCPYCAFENPIPADAAKGVVAERDYAAALRAQALSAPSVPAAAMHCDACGATTNTGTAVASRCAFCGSPLVAQPTPARSLRPDGVIPFAIAHDRAVALFRAWLQGLWFAPGALRREGRLDATVTGVYLPAWTFDARATTAYTGQRGDAYFDTVSERVTVNGKPQLRTRQVRRVRWSAASGTVENRFDDLLVLASTTLPAALVIDLEPWDLASVVPYADEYAAGFQAEYPTIGLEEGFEFAQSLARPTIESSVRSDIGGDEQRIESVRSRWTDISYRHVLLPVWISAYRYNNTVYQFVVNARTGEVQGRRPWSGWKIAGAVLLALLLAGLVAGMIALAGGGR